MPVVPTRAARRTLRILAVATAAAAALATSAPAQADSARASSASGTLEIAGDVPRPVTLDAAAFARLPRRTVRATTHGGTATYEGVPVAELLHAAGLPFGRETHALVRTGALVVRAADGYHVVFALSELDPHVRDRGIILADRRDGAPLDAKDGPFRLVVPDETRGGRSVRMVTRLEVRRVE